jgi:hypothetical protein
MPPSKRGLSNKLKYTFPFESLTMLIINIFSISSKKTIFQEYHRVKTHPLEAISHSNRLLGFRHQSIRKSSRFAYTCLDTGSFFLRQFSDKSATKWLFSRRIAAQLSQKGLIRYSLCHQLATNFVK